MPNRTSSEQRVRLDIFRRVVLKAVGMGGHKLAAINNDEPMHLVIALGDEPFSTLLTRVWDAGGSATVFVDTAEGPVILPIVRREHTADEESVVPLTMPQDADSSVGMFLDFVRKHPEGVALTVRTTDQPSFGIAEKPHLMQEAFT